MRDWGDWYLSDILDALIFDRTAEDVAARNGKGTYNAVDLNRVEAAVGYIRDMLVRYGYVVDLTTKTDWAVGDIPRIADMERYIHNILHLDGKIPYTDERTPLPETADKLSFDGANGIEKMLYTLGGMAENIEKSWLYAGMIESGVAYL